MLRRIIREALIGATSSGAVTKQRDVTSEVHSKTAIVVERHQFQESIELLNAMRKVGGVRRIESGSNDNGAPVGQISERVMRHVDFEGLNGHIQNGTDYDPREAPQWGQFGEAVRTEVPIERHRRPEIAPHQAQSAAVEVHRPKNVRTLQEELFG